MRDNVKRAVPVVAAVALVAMPFLLLCAIILRFAVNAPFWDDWEFVPLLQDYNNGTLTFHDLYAQHNEHRILFLNLATFAVGLTTHWNVRVLIFGSLVVAAASFVLLFLLMRRTIRGLWPLCLTATLVSLIVFSPVAWENWLWGFQLSWFFNVGGLILAVWALAGWQTKRTWLAIVVAIAGGTLATFSVASGVMSWLVCLPLFVLTPRLRRWTLLWIPVAAVEIFLYFTDYTFAANDGGLRFVAGNPKSSLEFVSVYLARPLLPVFSLLGAMLIGSLLLFVLVACSAYVRWRHRAEFPTVLPWLCLASYSVIAATLTATGRFTLMSELPGRYATIALLLTVAVFVVAGKAMQLAWSSREAEPGGAVVRYGLRFGPGLAMLALGIVLVGGYPTDVRQAHAATDKRRAAATCLHTVTRVEDPCLVLLYPDPLVVFPRIQYLRQIGWLTLDQPAG